MIVGDYEEVLNLNGQDRERSETWDKCTGQTGTWHFTRNHDNWFEVLRKHMEKLWNSEKALAYWSYELKETKQGHTLSPTVGRMKEISNLISRQNPEVSMK